MNERIQPPTYRAGISGEAGVADAFALAAARLRATRRLGSARLRQIASDLRAKAPEGAEQELREYLAEHPEDADALWLLAHVMMRVGRLREAVPLLERCAQVAPDFALARFNYASLLFHFCQFPAALNELEQLLSSDHHNPIFLELKADLLDAMGNAEKLLAIRQRLASEYPDRPESACRAAGL